MNGVISRLDSGYGAARDQKKEAGERSEGGYPDEVKLTRVFVNC
jgi:hypothetical protein